MDWHLVVETARTGIAFVALAVATASFFYRRGKDKDAQLEKRLDEGAEKMDGLDSRIDALDGRVTTLEAQMAALPTHEDIAALRQTISSVDRNLAELSGAMKAVQQLVAMIHESLLKGSGRAG